MKIFLMIFFVKTLIYALSFEVTNTNIANGASSLLTFDKEKNIVYQKITLDKKSFPIYPNPVDGTKMYAFVAVSYYAKPKNKTATIHYTKNGVKKTEKIALKIIQGAYKKESIHVTKSKVNPKKKHSLRISKEYHEAMKIYATATKENFLSSKFVLPLNSFITSDYGKARVYNDTLKGYHSGTDFRAKIGTPIIASNDGRIVLVKDRFYSGGTVIIDHGQGIYTCYYHMSAFKVKQNDKIKKGEVIGFSGKSGRVTGPHLHFSVRIAGVQVDPLQFVKLMNGTLLRKKNEKKMKDK
ncbi:M23 family metallopeptidase [Sulfurimonas sp. SAG-AH-194-I05]|nr:M23 family metallopeptidase [Sulfurimonas sp. SAG-AH-194-I05]MDF1874924.1 M23 family metallopeptidase [Sulfurimonas sp. SAG-AH-194-I05]